jgi:hypothetical protein
MDTSVAGITPRSGKKMRGSSAVTAIGSTSNAQYAAMTAMLKAVRPTAGWLGSMRRQGSDSSGTIISSQEWICAASRRSRWSPAAMNFHASPKSIPNAVWNHLK